MRRMTSMWSALPLVIAVTATWGCSDSSDVDSFGYRATKRGASSQAGADSTETSAKPTSYAVKGSISAEGAGSYGQRLAGNDTLAFAKTVRVSALLDGGKLEPVTEVPVNADGSFMVDVPANPVGVLIAEVLDVAGAVLGSGTVNGLIPAIDAALIMAPITTLTSFQTEVLATIAKGGVPGIANYLNVVNTFVDAQVANGAAVVGVFATDLKTIVGAVADAVVAAQGVIVAALDSVGIQLDLTIYNQVQSQLVKGLQDVVTTTTGGLLGSVTDLVAGLQAAALQVADGLDKQLFDAVLAGGMAFNTVTKGALPPPAADVKFAAVHSSFMAETVLVTEAVRSIFTQAGLEQSVLDMAFGACDKLLAQVAGATNIAALNSAKANFTNTLLADSLGNSVLGIIVQITSLLTQTATSTFSALGPLTKTLTSSLEQLVPAVGILNPADLTAMIQGIIAAVSQFNIGVLGLAPTFQAVMDPNQAKAIVDAIGLVQSLVAL